MTKRGQITIFILLGLVILLIFGFIFYTTSYQKETRQKTTTEKTILDSFKSTVVTERTTICLENSLQRGLNLLGRQGGYIYKDQPGGTTTPETIEYNEVKIPYLIKPKVIPLPRYPCPYPRDDPDSWYCNFSNDVSLFPAVYSLFPSVMLNCP